MRGGAKLERGEEGFALLGVLAFLLIFTSFLTPFVVASHFRVLTTQHTVRKAQLDFASEAAALVAASAYANWPVEKRVSATGKTYRCVGGNSVVDIEFQDHKGLIGLNADGVQTIAQGLVGLGIDKTQAQELARSIVEFRTPRRRPRKVEGPAPEAGYKLGFFEAVVELHDFPQLRRIEVNDLEQVFSVYKRSGMLSLAYAPDNLKQAFADAPAASNPAPERDEGVSQLSVAIYMAAGSRNWASNRYVVSYSGLERKFVKILSNSASPPSRARWEAAEKHAEAGSCNEILGGALPVLLNPL